MKWYQQKTTWTAIVGILGSIGGMATGTVDPITGTQSVIACLMAVFMRQGIEKK
jgi:hypothetical protein